MIQKPDRSNLNHWSLFLRHQKRHTRLENTRPHRSEFQKRERNKSACNYFQLKRFRVKCSILLETISLRWKRNETKNEIASTALESFMQHSLDSWNIIIQSIIALKTRPANRRHRQMTICVWVGMSFFRLFLEAFFFLLRSLLMPNGDDNDSGIPIVYGFSLAQLRLYDSLSLDRRKTK